MIRDALAPGSTGWSGEMMDFNYGVSVPAAKFSLLRAEGLVYSWTRVLARFPSVPSRPLESTSVAQGGLFFFYPPHPSPSVALREGVERHVRGPFCYGGV